MTKRPISKAKAWQYFGIGGVLSAILVPAGLWISLVVLSPFPAQVDLRTLGVYTLAATLYAIPTFMTSLVIAIVATVKNLRAEDKASK